MIAGIERRGGNPPVARQLRAPLAPEMVSVAINHASKRVSYAEDSARRASRLMLTCSRNVVG